MGKIEGAGFEGHVGKNVVKHIVEVTQLRGEKLCQDFCDRCLAAWKGLGQKGQLAESKHLTK